MKMNYLKKFGAVALAAVMAVTFAPVASLNVFAAKGGKDKDSAVAATNNDAMEDGVFAVTGTLKSATVSAGSVVTLYLADGAQITSGITVQTGASLTLVTTAGSIAVDDGTNTLRTATSAGAITLGNGASLTLDASLSGGSKAKKVDFNGTNAVDVTEIKYNGTDKPASVTIKGGHVGALGALTGATLTVAGGVLDNANFSASAVKKTEVTGGILKNLENDDLLNADKSKVFGDTPVASADEKLTTVYAGNDYINDNKDTTTYVLNGKVELKDMKAGSMAKISNNQFYGTASLTATAEKHVSLGHVAYTYSYKWKEYSTEKNMTGAATYKADAFYAGADNIAKNVVKLGRGEDDLNTNVLGFTALETPLVKYERAITIDENKDWKDQELAAPTDANIDQNGKYEYTVNYPSGPKKNVRRTVKGITYYTTDPTKYTDDATTIMVIDGNKYVIGGKDADTDTHYDNDGHPTDEVAAVADYAEKTIEFKRVAGWNKDNKNSKSAESFRTSNKDVKVTAPAETSILNYAEKNVTNGVETNDLHYEVFGGDYKVNNIPHTFNGITWKNPNNAERSIYASQIATGKIVDTEEQAADVKIGKADSVEYYSVMGGAAKMAITFGAAEDAKKQLSKDLSGYTENGITVDPIKDKCTIYVTKGIKGTFTGVNPMVIMDGELSEDEKTAADGTKTWVINEGYTSNAIPAYRMYRKSGEHVYTINPDEVSMLVNAGWINEGTAFYVNPVVSKKGTPVYRVYNKNNGGMHFYTASAAEKDMLLANGWTEGAVVFYGADKATGIPVYRTYNTGSNNGEHNYTTNIAESDMNVKAGWRAEGVAFYVFK